MTGEKASQTERQKGHKMMVIVDALFLDSSTSICLQQNYPSHLLLLGILLLQQLRDSGKLDVASSLIDSTDLAISPVLLGETFSHETHTAHPLDSLSRDSTSDLGGVELGHGGIHDKVLSGFLFTSSVVDHGASGADFRPRLCELMLHTLELSYESAELLAVVPDVAGGI